MSSATGEMGPTGPLASWLVHRGGRAAVVDGQPDQQAAHPGTADGHDAPGGIPHFQGPRTPMRTLTSLPPS